MAKKKLGLTSLSLFSSSNSSNCKKDISSGGATEAGLQLFPAPPAVAADSSSSSSSCSMPAASSPTSASSWQWPSCKLQPRTLSFRQQQQREMMIKQAYKTMNSAYFPDYSSTAGVDDDDSGCCFSSSFASLDVDTLIISSTCPVSDAEAEAVNRAMRSDRLFFEPELSPATYSSSSSMLVKKKKKKKAMVITNKKVEVNSSSGAAAVFDGATAVSMESTNPYGDFRASMEAMAMSHGGGIIKDWRWLEEMLGWFLRANDKGNHGLIVGAFVDMLVALTATNSSSTKCYSCSSFSLREGGNGIVEEITKEEDR